MHGQARGAGIAPAAAAGTTRAPPRRGSLAYASRLRATGNKQAGTETGTGQRRQKKGDGERRELAITIKRTKQL